MPLASGETILNGKYRVVRLIGEGGMARVWLAEELTFGDRQVAIKQPRTDLPPEDIQDLQRRYQREVQVCAALEKARVPNIVRALTAEPYEGALLLVLEFMPGGDLAGVIKDNPDGLPMPRALEISRALLLALKGTHEHALDIVHRDVKPSNVLFDEAGAAHLGDFGLAQIAGTSGRSQLRSGLHPGTPLYMAPEQALSVEYLTPSADLFALGCLIFEMLTGKRYKRQVKGTKASALRAEVPTWLDDILARMLAEDPSERYQSADEVTAALARGAADLESAQRAAEAAARRQAEAAEGARRVSEQMARLQAEDAARREQERAQREAAEAARREAERRALEDRAGRDAMAQTPSPAAAPQSDPGQQAAPAVGPAEVAQSTGAAQVGTEESRLAGLFATARAAANRSDWFTARDLLLQVVKVRPDYRSGEASSLLAQAEHALATPTKRRGPLSPLVLVVIGLVAVVVLIAGGQAVLSSLGTPTPFVDYATATAEPIGSTAVPVFEATPAPTRANSFAASPTTRPTASAKSTGSAISRPTAAATSQAGGASLALAGTPVPQHSAPIGAANASRLAPLARWGLGGMLSADRSSDGKLIAVASYLGVYVYDAENLSDVQWLQANAPIQSVAFSPDGRLLAAACFDGTVKLWESTGQQLRPLAGHQGPVRAVAFSPDGRTLASGGDDRMIVLWDVATGTEERTLSGHSNTVWAVAFSPNGKSLASASVDTTLKLWDVASGRDLGTLSGHSQAVWGLAFSPDGRMLASAGGDSVAKIWDVATLTELGTLSGHTGPVNCVAFSSDGKTVATGSADSTIRVWDVASGKNRTLGVLGGPVYSLTFLPGTGGLVSTSADAILRIVDVASGTELRTAEQSPQIARLAYSPDGQTLATGGGSGKVYLWDASTGDLIRSFAGTTAVTDLAISPDGRTLAVASWQSLRLWDLAGGKQPRTFNPSTGWVDAVAFSTDGKYIASAGADRMLRVWDLATGDQTASIGPLNEVAYSLAESSDDQNTAAGIADGAVMIWNSTTGQAGATLGTLAAPVRAVAFSPDGQLLASGGADGAVTIWVTATGRPFGTLSGLGSAVLGLAFSPDGKTLAAGTSDARVRLWDVPSGRELGTLTGHTSWVQGIAFSPDGRTLATGSDDGTIRLWGVP